MWRLVTVHMWYKDAVIRNGGTTHVCRNMNLQVSLRVRKRLENDYNPEKAHNQDTQVPEHKPSVFKEMFESYAVGQWF